MFILALFGKLVVLVSWSSCWWCRLQVSTRSHSTARIWRQRTGNSSRRWDIGAFGRRTPAQTLGHSH